MLTGWEGSATDARVYEDACQKGLNVPAGKYFLADAGFPLCLELLIPFRNVRYHLAEWGSVRLRYYKICLNLMIYILIFYQAKNQGGVV